MNHYSPDDLARCRVTIDELDLRLLELLNERTVVVEEIGRIKQSLQMAVYEPKREDQGLRQRPPPQSRSALS